MRIQYVVPDSPAAEAGIKRGDSFSKFNGQLITRSNYHQLYSSTEAISTLTRVKLSLTSNGVIAEDPMEITLSAAKEIEISPFYKSSILTVDGKKIPYLMYGSFVRGITDNSNEYFGHMRKIFDEFGSNAVDAFILDLRLNSGGYLSCAQQLATLLTPKSAFSGRLGYLKYRDGSRSLLNFTNEDKPHNLDLKKLYIIVSGSTASASEFIINSLKPYMGDNLVVIGTTTEGKNVASLEYEGSGPAEGWIIKPINSMVFNSKDKSDYADGFIPALNHRVNERDATNAIAIWYEYGDTKEYLLKNVINVIRTGSVLNPSGTRVDSATLSDMEVIIPKQESSFIIDTLICFR